MNYLVIVHKDADSDYGVTVPDLPGCFSAGSSPDEAQAMAKEAIELHLEGLSKEGRALPAPTRLEDLKDNPEYKDAVWANIEVDPGHP